MYSSSSTSKKSTLQLMSDKRSKHRLQIRKVDKKHAIESRRHLLIENLREQLLQQLADRFKGLTAEQTVELLEELEERVASEEFNNRLLQMGLDGTLVALLKEGAMGLQAKLTIVNVLCQLAWYSELEHISIIQPKIIEQLLTKQSLSYSFTIPLQRQYITSLLTLIYRLTVITPNPELYDFLTSSCFCQQIARKLCLQVDPQGLQKDNIKLMKYITRIRRALISSKWSLDFVMGSLDYLEDTYSEFENLCPLEYCRLVVACVDGCPENRRRQLGERLDSHLMVNFQMFFQGEMWEELAIGMLELMDSLWYYFEQLVERVLEFTPMSFFLQCLKSRGKVGQQCLCTLSHIGTILRKHYPQDPQLNLQLIPLIYIYLDSQTQQLPCLLLIQNLTRGNYWTQITEQFLKQNIITRVAELLKQEALSADCMECLMKVLDNLLEYARGVGDDRVRNSLHSQGIVNVLENLEEREDRIYKMAFRLLAECMNTKNGLQQD